MSVKIEIVPRTVTPDPDPLDVASAKLDIQNARRAGDADAIRAAQLAYVDVLDVEPAVQWFAVVNGTEVPLAAFDVQPPAEGSRQALVSLLVPVDHVHVGPPVTEPVSAPVVRAESEPKVSTWGDPSVPDPRESIPGWSKPDPAQAAEGGEQSMTVSLAPTGAADDWLVEGMRKRIRLQGNSVVTGAARERPWSLTEVLLAQIERHLALAGWQREGMAGPKPVQGGLDIAGRLRALGLLPERGDDGLAGVSA